MAKCLQRAFGSVKLFCPANSLNVQSVRNFTVLNMHAAKGAYPYLRCKGADTVTILKWLRFYASLSLQDDTWSDQDKLVLKWISKGAAAGLCCSQGIHAHGIWLKRSCAVSLRQATQRFVNAYGHLAAHCHRSNYALFGMVPKLHVFCHFRTDYDDAIEDSREWTLNCAVYDCSMSEDFIERVARQSRRMSFRNIERNQSSLCNQKVPKANA